MTLLGLQTMLTACHSLTRLDLSDIVVEYHADIHVPPLEHKGVREFLVTDRLSTSHVDGFYHSFSTVHLLPYFTLPSLEEFAFAPCIARPQSVQAVHVQNLHNFLHRSRSSRLASLTLCGITIPTERVEGYTALLPGLKHLCLCTSVFTPGMMDTFKDLSKNLRAIILCNCTGFPVGHIDRYTTRTMDIEGSFPDGASCVFSLVNHDIPHPMLPASNA
ncbi:hypothetical protein OF83DRAFT_1172468 [Amylostereum chailletii]|nr:hypothetical protein OF83DRAFT_1172468 [Amylostereum chailletii]